MQRKRYPSDWEVIARRIREREGYRCKSCGVAHGSMAVSVRGRSYRVVLTVAHLGVPYPDGRPGDPHDKMDVRGENLAALCQPCHLRYDVREHMRSAALTRRQRLITAGQLELFTV